MNPSVASRRWRIAAGVIGLAIAFPLVLGLLLAALLHEDSTATWLTNTALRHVEVWPNAEVSIERVDLSGFRTLTIRELRVESPSGEKAPMVSIEALEARVDILPLIRRRLSLPRVHATGVAVRMRQRADSTWDLLAPFSPEDDVGEERPPADPWTLVVGRVEVDDASIHARFLNTPDSVKAIGISSVGGAVGHSVGRVEGLNLRAHDLLLGRELAVTLDTLDARIHPPARPASPARISATMNVQDGSATMGLQLVSDSSDVSARVRIRLPEGSGDGIRDLDVHVSAAPLDFRDVGAVLPGMDVPGSARLEARAWGSDDLLEIEVEGRSFDGATIDVRGEATPRRTGPLRYVLEARVRGLAPALWTESDGPLEGMDVDVSLDLSGPAMDSLDGHASLRVAADRLGDGALRSTHAELLFERGTAHLDLRGSAPPWVGVVATGTGRPFDTRPSYDIQAELEQLGPVWNEGTRVSSGAVTLHLEGSGVTPEQATGRVTLSVGGRLGDAEVRGGVLRATWADGRGRAELDVPIGDGHVAASVLGDWSGEAARLELPTFDLTRLDVAALLGDSAAGRLSMRGTGELVWGEAGTRAGDVEAVLEDARWGALVLDTGRVSVELRDGTLSARAWLLSPAGGLELEAGGRPFDEVRTWRVDRLTAHSVNLARANDGLPESDIGLTLRMEGELPSDPRLGTASGVLVLSPSTIGPERVDTAEVRVAFREGLLEAEGEAEVMRGAVRFVGEARPLGDAPEFRLERMDFDGLRPDSTWVGPFPVELSGVISARGTLPEEVFPDIRARVEFGPGTVNRARLEGGRATLETTAGRVLLEAMLRTERGRLELDGEAELERGDDGIGLASLVGAGEVELPDLEEVLGLDADASLQGRFDVAGGRRDGSMVEWSGSVTASGTLGNARLYALEVEGGIADDVLRIDTLRVASNVLRGSGGGAVALGDSVATPPEGIRVLLVVDSADALAGETSVRPLSLRGGTLELRATNPARGVRLEATFGAGGLIAAGFGADTLSGVATATLRGRSVEAGTARVRGGTLGWGSVTLESVQGDMAYDSAGGARYALEARRDGAHELYTVGTVRPRDSTMRIDSLRISLPDDQWELAEATTLRWGDQLVIEGFDLEARPGLIAVEGYVDRGGTQDLSVALREVRLDGFADLVGLESLEGTMDGRLDLSGPAERLVVSGNLDATLGDVRIEATVRTVEASHALEVLVTDDGGGSLRMNGTLPLDVSLVESEQDAPGADGELAITATALSLDWLTPFVRPLGVTELAGELDVDARVEAPLSRPRLHGTAELEGGLVRIPAQGVLYRDTRADLELMGDRIAIRGMRMSAGGNAELEGEIVLDPLSNPQFDLTTAFHRFRAVENEWTRLVMSGELTLTGDLEGPRVGGAVSFVNTDIYADPVSEGGGGGPVELTEEDFEMLEAYFGYRPSESASIERDPILGWAMDVSVTLQRDVWLRKSTQPELRLELQGDLDVAKEAGDSIQLFGTIEVLPERSYFQELGRRFDVTDGTVTFNGSIWDWEADVRAEYPVESFRDPSAPEVTITLAVTGGMDDLEMTMGSDPAMETADMLSYIATGRPAQSAAQFGVGGQEGGGSDGVAGLGASLALDRVAGALEGVAADAAGLDVVEIRQRGLEGATLVAGRYVSSRLFVGFQQPLTAGSNADDALGRTVPGTQVELEYSAYSWLMMSLRGGESTVSFFLRTKRAF